MSLPPTASNWRKMTSVPARGVLWGHSRSNLPIQSVAEIKVLPLILAGLEQLRQVLDVRGALGECADSFVPKFGKHPVHMDSGDPASLRQVALGQRERKPVHGS